MVPLLHGRFLIHFYHAKLSCIKTCVSYRVFYYALLFVFLLNLKETYLNGTTTSWAVFNTFLENIEYLRLEIGK